MTKAGKIKIPHYPLFSAFIFGLAITINKITSCTLGVLCVLSRLIKFFRENQFNLCYLCSAFDMLHWCASLCGFFKPVHYRKSNSFFRHFLAVNCFNSLCITLPEKRKQTAGIIGFGFTHFYQSQSFRRFI